MREGFLGARPLVEPGRQPRTFGAGRLCAHPGCATRLSIYNPGRYCYEHEPKVQPRTRGRRDWIEDWDWAGGPGGH